MAYKIHRCIKRTSISPRHIKKKKKNKVLILCDEINILNIIYENTFNLYNRLLNNDNRYMKVTLKSKQIGVAG